MIFIWNDLKRNVWHVLQDINAGHALSPTENAGQMIVLQNIGVAHKRTLTCNIMIGIKLRHRKDLMMKK